MKRVNIVSRGPLKRNIEKITLEENGEIVDITQDVFSASINLKPTGVNTITMEFMAGNVELNGLQVLEDDSKPPAPIPGVYPSGTPESTPTAQRSVV